MLPQLQLLGGAWPDEPGLDTALSTLILARVSAGEMPATLRIYTPGREVAFGKRDAVTPQYPAAVAAAKEAGFAPIERLAGGRAAVFTEHTVAFALAVPSKDPRTMIQDRFREMGDMVVATFARLGVPAQVGEVPGEYCPGQFSVNHDGRLKLMGVGQRLARHATHIGGVIAVDRTDLMLRALIPVYRALQIEWRPPTTGSLTDIRPGIDGPTTMAAFKTELASRYDVTKGRISDELVALARELSHRYRPEGEQAPGVEQQ